MAVPKIRLAGSRQVMYLGCNKPEEVLDAGPYVKLKTKAGKEIYVPKLGAFFDDKRLASPPPESVDWHTKAAPSLKEVYGNDQQGDCVIASALHQGGVWHANARGAQLLSNTEEALAQYHEICGRGDNGCMIAEVLDHTRDRGLRYKGVVHKVEGYCMVDWTNKTLVQVVLHVFGSIKLGIDLPSDWTCTDCTWSPTRSGIVGGHDVPCVGYNAEGVQISTWGGIVTITWDAFTSRKWLSEAYVVLSPDWSNDEKLSPNGFDVEGLRKALETVRGGGTPVIDPPTPPGPDPVPPTPPGPTPAPPTSWDVNLTGTYADIFGRMREMVLRGTAVPNTGSRRGCGCGLGGAAIPWMTILLDVLRLLGDVSSRAPMEKILADIELLLHDLGIDTPHPV